MQQEQERVASSVLMVTPTHFAFNAETAKSNDFQNDQALQQDSASDDVSLEQRREEIRQKALAEAAEMAALLAMHDIHVIVLPAREDVHTPDEVFPNNWVSFHQDGMMVLYPMLVNNRRLERQSDAAEQTLTADGLLIRSVLDLSRFEDAEQFLEGTGSMVIDRQAKIAFACLSPRTNKELFLYYCDLLGYTPVVFHATNDKNAEIYHTNVMMAIGDGLSVICLDAIQDPAEREHVQEMLQQANLEILAITQEQMNAFCGNVLQVKDKRGNATWIMSKTAYDAFTDEQKAQLQKYGQIVACDIETIEKNGGGSARCMLAEVFLPQKTE